LLIKPVYLGDIFGDRPKGYGCMYHRVWGSRRDVERYSWRRYIWSREKRRR